LRAIITSTNMMVMVESFKYRVDGNHPEVTLHVSQQFWQRLTKGLLWSVAWSTIAYACVYFLGFTIPPLIGLFVCLVLVVIGLFVVNFSLVWSTVWLRPDTVRWREIRPFRWRTRSFPLLAIRDFGFAFFSHNGPVLRMDVDGTGYVLAEEIQEREANAVLLDITRRGIDFPVRSSDRLNAHASIPRVGDDAEVHFVAGSASARCIGPIRLHRNAPYAVGF
jgi:hypothetical protein